MSSSLAVLALGFVLGMRHATDADHVLAVTTIVSRYRTFRDAAWIGICWGIGHSLTILVVGGGIVVFKWVIPPRLGLSMEFAVGLMLVALGVSTIASILRRGRAERAHHDHAAEPHSHGEGAPVTWLDRHLGRLGLYRATRPLLIGMVHGLAGSAAVALLVLTAIDDPFWASVYLVIFGIGTVLGMMLMTTALATPFVYAGRRFTRLGEGLGIGAGILSLGLGLLVAYRIGVDGGLFTR